MENNNYTIPIAIVIAGALITWGIFSNKIPEVTPEITPENTGVTQAEKTQQENQEKLSKVSFEKSDHILGNPEAKIKMITFSDFECPYCKTFHESMIKITDEYAKDGKVAWTMRQFPVHGEPTQIKAIASECAGFLGGETKFWEMSTRIFETTETDGWISITDLPIIAVAIGLDEEKFNNCLNDQKIISKVQADFQDGIDLEVKGTPFTAVVLESGETFSIPGAQPYADIKNMVEMILSDQITQ